MSCSSTSKEIAFPLRNFTSTNIRTPKKAGDDDTALPWLKAAEKRVHNSAGGQVQAAVTAIHNTSVTTTKNDARAYRHSGEVVQMVSQVGDYHHKFEGGKVVSAVVMPPQAHRELQGKQNKTKQNRSCKQWRQRSG